LSLGGFGSWNKLHKHLVAVHSQVQGRKMWWLSATRAGEPDRMNDQFEHWGGNICGYLKGDEFPVKRNAYRCVVPPGYTILVPPLWFHGTCNLDSWTISYVLEGLHLSPLELAASIGDVAEAMKLIPTVDLRRKEESGQQVLHAAAFNGHRSMIELLIEHRAEVNALDDEQQQPGHLAAGNGHISALEALIERRAELAGVKGTGLTLAHSAASLGKRNALDLLITHGADLAASDADSGSILQAAVISGSPSTVKLLIDSKVALDDPAFDGATSVHRAAMVGTSSVLVQLLDAGGNMRAKDKNDYTPFHYAAGLGHVEALEILLERDPSFLKSHGADHIAKLAAQRRHLAVVKLLVAHGADHRLLKDTPPTNRDDL